KRIFPVSTPGSRRSAIGCLVRSARIPETAWTEADDAFATRKAQFPAGTVFMWLLLCCSQIRPCRSGAAEKQLSAICGRPARTGCRQLHAVGAVLCIRARELLPAACRPHQTGRGAASRVLYNTSANLSRAAGPGRAREPGLRRPWASVRSALRAKPQF